MKFEAQFLSRGSLHKNRLRNAPIPSIPANGHDSLVNTSYISPAAPKQGVWGFDADRAAPPAAADPKWQEGFRVSTQIKRSFPPSPTASAWSAVPSRRRSGSHPCTPRSRVSAVIFDAYLGFLGVPGILRPGGVVRVSGDAGPTELPSSATGTMLIPYNKCGLDVEGNILGMALQGSRGSAELVALFNFATICYAKIYGPKGPVPEKHIKDILLDTLQDRSSHIRDIKPADVREMRTVLANIRTQFCLQPRLSSPQEFVNNASLKLCRVLGLPVLHGWVVSPEARNYMTVKDFSYAELLEYCCKLEGQDGEEDNLAACKSLMHDSKNQLTSYGFGAIAAELNDDGIQLIYCRNRLDLILKHADVLFIFVTDENTRNKMPDAAWMVFEECQDNNIYFNEEFFPVKGQPCEEKARKFSMSFLENVKGQPYEEKPWKFYKSFLENQNPSPDPAQAGATCTGLPPFLENQKAKSECNRKKKLTRKKRTQNGQFEPEAVVSHQSEYQDDDKVPLEDDDKVPLEDDDKVPLEDDDKVPEALGGPHGTGMRLEDDKTAEALVAHHIERLDATVSSTEEDKTSETVVSHHTDSLDSIGSSPEADARTEEAVEASLCEVPEGVASDFFRFLMEFKGDRSSEPYFEGIVAAFPSHHPVFYVPYNFIMAYDEELALKIQDNYSRIYEDLKKSVVYYLSKNEVHFAGIVLEIIGLPEPKSVQRFRDFLKSINLHERYEVCGENPEALPSYDGRRMGLGYARCIVAKFRTGKCWAGDWSEPNMKVKKGGSEFVIECEKDYVLTPDLGYLDLQKLSTIFECFRIDGRLPPFFDEFGEDIMLITNCFEDPLKWERFLELISNPLCLKPPLVQASLLCNVFLGAKANSSGDPPRYTQLYSMKGCYLWRLAATRHHLLKTVYSYRSSHLRMKMNYLMDTWADSHWHVFKFSRYFIHHILDYTKDDDLIQKVKDISVVSILLVRTMCKAIARSVRFLVLDCGVDGLFSSAWRCYAGSDYVDKPNALEDATVSDMMQGLVDNISHAKRTAYVCSEVIVYSEQHVSVVFGDADLARLKSDLNNNGLKCEMDHDGSLRCGSIMLSSRFHPATKKTGRSVIVVQGPFSTEYESVFSFLTQWLGL